MCRWELQAPNLVNWFIGNIHNNNKHNDDNSNKSKTTTVAATICEMVIARITQKYCWLKTTQKEKKHKTILKKIEEKGRISFFFV